MTGQTGQGRRDRLLGTVQTGQGRRDRLLGTGQTGHGRRDRLLTTQTGHLRALFEDISIATEWASK